MTPLPPPICPETFASLTSLWETLRTFHESGSMYYYNKNDFYRRYIQFTSPMSSKDKQRYFLLDIESTMVEDIEEWEQLLSHVPETTELLFITGIDALLLERRCDIFAFLDTYATITRLTISVLLVFQIDFSAPRFSSVFSTSTTFMQNMFFQPLYDQKNCEHFAQYLQTKWGMRVDPNLVHACVTACGGYFLLLKSSIRLLRDHPDYTFEQICLSDDLKVRVEKIFSSLLLTQQHVVRLCSLHKPLPTDANIRHDVSFLLRTHWLKQKGKQIVCAIPLLASTVRLQEQKRVFTVLRGGELFLNGLPVKELFGKKEQVVLQYLCRHEGKTVSRDALAPLVGGDRTVSNWAIDQLIRRIRKRMISLELDPDIVKTVYGKGYMICQK